MISRVISIFCLIVFFACNSSDQSLPSDVQNFLDKEQEESLIFFSNVGLLRRGKNLQLEIKNEGSIEKYNFLLDEGKVTYKSEALESWNLKIPCCTSELDNKEQMLCVVNCILAKLEGYQIQSASHSFKEFGVDLVFYFSSGHRLYYVKEISSLKNKEWSSFIFSLEDLGSGWFYGKRELF